jgi:invasion protein IalB
MACDGLERSKAAILVAEIVVMISFRAIFLRCAVMWLALVPAMAAAASTPAPAPASAPAAAAPPAAAPNAMTPMKVYGDWTVRCFNVTSPAPCDMYQLLTDKKSGERVMSVSIAYLPTQDRHVLQIAVPLGVKFSKGLVITMGDTKSTPFFFRRCASDACYVERVVDAKVMAAFLHASGLGRVTIVSENGKSFQLPLSFNGFSEAHGDMADLNRQRASAAPAK